jgi:c-di-GMP-binding flagellar brake protein YcgR
VQQQERRQFTRVTVDVPVKLLVTGRRGPVAARLDNLSEGGCYFAADVGLKTGWQVSLSFMMTERRLCSAMGTIVRETQTSGFGVEFTTINEALRALIQSLVSATDEDRPRLVAQIADGEIHIG